MKLFKLQRLLLMLALVVVIQNGTIIVSGAANDTSSYSEDEGISTQSDKPYPNDTHS